MTRSTKLSLKDMNRGKYESLDRFMVEALRVLNLQIDSLWDPDLKKLPKYMQKTQDTWLSVRAQYQLGNQALHVCKSQRKKKIKTKPVVTKESIDLDYRFFNLKESEGRFDLWIRFASLGEKIRINVPTQKHEHFNSFIEDGWTLKNSIRLRRVDGIFYVDVVFGKEAPSKRIEGKDLGFDCGYNNLLVDSEGDVHDKDLKSCYESISRKKRGSKRFKRALRRRDQLVKEVVKSIDLSEVKTVVVEALKDVKRGSKGKRSKSFNNKLQRWTYPKVLGALSSRCEVEGICYIEVPPAHTSQKCSLCGHVDRASRVNSLFRCTSCGHVSGADFNAAKNILHLGVTVSGSLKVGA